MPVGQGNRAQTGATTGIENKLTFPALDNPFKLSEGLEVVCRHRFAPRISQMLENRFFEAGMRIGLAARDRLRGLIHRQEFALWV